MSIRLTKPWIELATLDHDELPAQLGVFQLADADRNVIYIGYGGGLMSFGLRTAVVDAANRIQQADAVRYEVTHGYLSRWEELMMVYVHDHDRPPVANDTGDAPRGRLDPIGAGSSDSPES